MGLEQKQIGTRIFLIDRKDKLLFTKTELKTARARYVKEFAKAAAKGQV